MCSCDEVIDHGRLIERFIDWNILFKQLHYIGHIIQTEPLLLFTYQPLTVTAMLLLFLLIFQKEQPASFDLWIFKLIVRGAYLTPTVN